MHEFVPRAAILRETGAMNEKVSLLERVRAMKSEIDEIGHRHGVSNIRVFGSAARGESTSESDLDMLVDISPDRSLLDLSGFYLDVKDLLGIEIDVVTDGEHLHQRFRERVRREAVTL